MLAVPVLADEGMWLPNQLPMIGQALEAAGLDTPPAKLADLTGDPMGAIVSLGGCTRRSSRPGVWWSPTTTAPTAPSSTTRPQENNLLENGFLAAIAGDELPGRARQPRVW